ncbi:hypothetical protein [Streptomyces rubrogriseus]|uniref:hypothetical protein n=1 Tax=Streptomyces rubrogriseus TaxID=194673 RepID=UPI000D59A59F
MTGLFSIPEGMAYASVAGFGPVAGPYAGVVPAVVGSPTARAVLTVTTLTSAIARPRARVEGGMVPARGACSSRWRPPWPRPAAASPHRVAARTTPTRPVRERDPPGSPRRRVADRSAPGKP